MQWLGELVRAEPQQLYALAILGGVAILGFVIYKLLKNGRKDPVNSYVEMDTRLDRVENRMAGYDATLADIKDTLKDLSTTNQRMNRELGRLAGLIGRANGKG